LYLAKQGNFQQIVSVLQANGGEEITFLERKSVIQRSSSEYNKKLLLLSAKKADLSAVGDLIKKGVDPNYIVITEEPIDRCKYLLQ